MTLPINRKTILFVSGTRADFGKLNPLISSVNHETLFETRIFVTGMHMLKEYGHTFQEVIRKCPAEKFLFINQRYGDEMDTIFAKTVQGFSDYIREQKPDLIVIHGDRLEALAAATVAMLNGCRIAHIEGGELSGTVDESMRHAITKMSHLHFVSNPEAKGRLLQLGESDSSIFVIGSPEIDIMNSEDLPSIEVVKQYYGLDFEEYGICIFHPVTTEVDAIRAQAESLVNALISTGENFLIVLPNNDKGSFEILNAYEKIKGNSRFRVIPSLRFEYYLVALREAMVIVGNSSSGVREAPYFGVPSVNLGSRQQGRAVAETIVNVGFEEDELIQAIRLAKNFSRTKSSNFGDGKAGQKFLSTLSNPEIWEIPLQKYFVDLTLKTKD
jgi:UDP-N-acetylglucosamine 2-epimerase (hydrolysing)